MTVAKACLAFFTAALLIIVAPSSSYAQAQIDEFYNTNTIRFYHPMAAGCSVSSSFNSEANSDYRKKPILNKTQVDTLLANKPIYEKAAETNNVPWELLASIHFKELGFRRYSPSNGYGPYQVKTLTYAEKSSYTSEEFEQVTNEAAAAIRAIEPSSNLSDATTVKRVLFKHNNSSQLYIDQGVALGFTVTDASNGEGSPYVMNIADARRDSSSEVAQLSSIWKRLDESTGNLVSQVDQVPGAFIVYSALKSVDIDGLCKGEPKLSEGGMSLGEATAFMNTYRTSGDSVSYIGSASRACAGGALANCSSFSGYFVNKYTSLEVFKGRNVGNGGQVVSNILSRDGRISGGKVPKPFAVFSRPGTTNGGAGHTGVVLGIDASADSIIIGEAACGLPLSWAIPHVYKLSSYTNTIYNYAYIGDYVVRDLK